jgi:hypothetical protein
LVETEDEGAAKREAERIHTEYHVAPKEIGKQWPDFCCWATSVSKC